MKSYPHQAFLLSLEEELNFDSTSLVMAQLVQQEVGLALVQQHYLVELADQFELQVPFDLVMVSKQVFIAKVQFEFILQELVFFYFAWLIHFTIIHQLFQLYHHIQNYDGDYHQDQIFKLLLVEVIRSFFELVAISSFNQAYFAHTMLVAQRLNSMVTEVNLVISFEAEFMDSNLIFIQVLTFVDFDPRQELFTHLKKVLDQLQDFFDQGLVFKQVILQDLMLVPYFDSIESQLLYSPT